jgi:hypothetical protein
MIRTGLNFIKKPLEAVVIQEVIIPPPAAGHSTAAAASTGAVQRFSPAVSNYWQGHGRFWYFSV